MTEPEKAPQRHLPADVMQAAGETLHLAMLAGRLRLTNARRISDGELHTLVVVLDPRDGSAFIGGRLFGPDDFPHVEYEHPRPEDNVAPAPSQIIVPGA